MTDLWVDELSGWGADGSGLGGLGAEGWGAEAEGMTEERFELPEGLRCWEVEWAEGVEELRAV